MLPTDRRTANCSSITARARRMLSLSWHTQTWAMLATRRRSASVIRERGYRLPSAPSPSFTRSVCRQRRW